MTEGVEYLSAQAKEKTDGAFDISLQYGGALAGQFEVLEGIESGAFEVGIACTAFAAGKLPLLSGLELPFIPADTIEKRRALQEAYMAQPEIVSELEKWNAVALASVLLPNYQDHAEIFLMLVAIPSILGEMALAVWLLVKGGKQVEGRGLV